MRQCYVCKETKPLDEFTNKGHGCKSYRCKKCHNKRQKPKQRKQKKACFAELIETIGPNCAICGKPATAMDHNHDTGQIRGLLCHNCNRGIGLLGDDAANMRRAAEYLEAGHEYGMYKKSWR